jgi:hypothetical protein
MSSVKWCRCINRLRYFLGGFFLAGCLTPLMASTVCTEKMVQNLVSKNIEMRVRFLKNENRMPVFEAATVDHLASIRQHIAEKNWDGVCREGRSIIGIADDVLAGGDGKTQPLKHPWDKCTPEKMFSLAVEYDLICSSEQRGKNCTRQELQPLRRELMNLQMREGKGDLKAVQYMNRTCELYAGLLEIVNQ